VPALLQQFEAILLAWTGLSLAPPVL